jgi:hypothetical protein
MSSTEHSSHLPAPSEKTTFAKEAEARLASSPPTDSPSDLERVGQSSSGEYEKGGHRVMDATVVEDVFAVDKEGAPDYRGVTFAGALALMLKSYVLSSSNLGDDFGHKPDRGPAKVKGVKELLSALTRFIMLIYPLPYDRQLGLGVLSLPNVMNTLGLVPGLLALAILGALSSTAVSFPFSPAANFK